MSSTPASVAKIVTAWLAMEVLGADYRFKTRFYLDRDRVLYIRGGGDPFLISEELAQLASALVAAIGKQPLSGIVLDAGEEAAPPADKQLIPVMTRGGVLRQHGNGPGDSGQRRTRSRCRTPLARSQQAQMCGTRQRQCGSWRTPSRLTRHWRQVRSAQRPVSLDQARAYRLPRFS